MGNIWGSERIVPINGTYLGERRRPQPRRRLRESSQKSLEEPLLEPAPPQEHWKVKALRIIHYVAEKSRTINREMLLQTEG